MLNIWLILFITIILFYFLTRSGNSSGVFENNFSFLEAKYRISLLAKIVKSDGRVNETEAYLISQILDDFTAKFGGNLSQREELKEIYNIEKENLNNAYDIAKEYKQTFNLNPIKSIAMIYFFLNIAYIDGNFSVYEKQIIGEICDGFGINGQIKEQIFHKFDKDFNAKFGQNRSNAQDPYEILGIQRGASFDEVKKQYRILVKKYHPDILMGKKASDTIIEESTRKLQAINEAYATIKKELGK